MDGSEKPSFGKLITQNVRDHWESEMSDFTPWLVESIKSDGTSCLEDTLGLDLEVVGREKKVGKYYLDILAEVVDDDRQVVVENQLEQSDHDHLGKSLAYAAGVDADIIVWIAPSFNDEHRDAVQWLNQNSRDGIDLFAIQLEVWRIDDSQPAVQLNPVEKPSEWRNRVQQSTRDFTELEELRMEFWTQFRDQVKSASTPLRPREPRPINHVSNPIGKKGFHISFVHVNDDDELRLDLRIEDEGAFIELRDDGEKIEDELGGTIRWREPPKSNSRGYISVIRDAHLEDREEWDEYFDWFLENGERFHEVFGERIQQL